LEYPTLWERDMRLGLLAVHKRRWEDNIKMDVEDMGRGRGLD